MSNCATGIWRAALLVLALAVARTTLADSVSVPAAVQANLVAKLLAFDRGLGARAGGAVRVLVVVEANEGQSRRIANEFTAALKTKNTIAGLPIETTISDFAGAAALADKVRTEHISAVYLSSGLADKAESIAKALTGSNVMTIAAEPAAVIRGVAIGFDLLSGQPKILLNLNLAKRQGVQLPGAVLSLVSIQGGD